MAAISNDGADRRSGGDVGCDDAEETLFGPSGAKVCVEKMKATETNQLMTFYNSVHSSIGQWWIKSIEQHTGQARNTKNSMAEPWWGQKHTGYTALNFLKTFFWKFEGSFAMMI